MHRVAILIAVLVAAVVQPARAQWVVYDAATTGRNTVSATVAELALAIERQQHERIRQMAARLSAVTDVRRLSASMAPLWPEARLAGSPLSQAFEVALHLTGDDGRAYEAAVERLGGAPTWEALLSPTRRSALAASLATIQAADATSTAAIQHIGALREAGRQRERLAIDSLSADVLNGSDAQSATAVLEKTLGATTIGVRQRQARIGLLTDFVEQLLIDGKRTRDTASSALNMQMETWRSAASANRALMNGAGDALNSWRQP